MNYSSIIKLPKADERDESFVFSIHKAGSSLLFGMIDQVCNENNISCISIPDALFLDGIRDEQWIDDTNLLSLFKKGYLYFGFRIFPNILLKYGRLKASKKVFLIRDPRDILVSQYFSFGGKFFSHRTPNKSVQEFLDRNTIHKDLNIDEYVIIQSEYLHNKIYNYKKAILDDNLFIVNYERLYLEKQQCLEEILFHIGIECDKEKMSAVVTQHDIRPVSEQTSKHVRVGSPGDHKNKLKGETIETLNTMFREIMLDFGYTL